MKVLTFTLVLLTCASCSLIPQRTPRHQTRTYCAQAAQMGWCTDICNLTMIDPDSDNVIAFSAGPSDGACIYKDRKGNIYLCDCRGKHYGKDRG